MNNLFFKLAAFTTILSLALNSYAARKNKDDNYHYDYNAMNDKCSVYDPYQGVNRKIYIFNAVLDTFILRPVAKGYGKFTNDYTKGRVGSFIANVNEPLSTVNYGAQGKGEGMGKSFWRFAINSTLGIGGLFDVASKFDVKSQPQTFGNTLAHYGVGAGPYIVVPFFGGSSARDVMDSIVLNSALNPIKYPMHSSFKTGLFAVNLVHSRDVIMPFTDYVTKNSTDTYITIRDAIINERESKVIYPAGFKCATVKNKNK